LDKRLVEVLEFAV
jgi:hypothetical protein